MWAKISSILVGLWIMVSPAIIGMSPNGTDNNYVTGPLVITFAVISLWQVNSPAIKANYVIALWGIIAPLFISFNSSIGIVSNIVSALLVILLARVPTKTTEKFGGGWRSLLQKDPEHARQPAPNK